MVASYAIASKACAANGDLLPGSATKIPGPTLGISLVTYILDIVTPCIFKATASSLERLYKGTLTLLKGL